MTDPRLIICFEPAVGDGQWGEPFVVSAADDSEHGRQCEAENCEAISLWLVEVAGWQGAGDPPYNCPTLYLCSEHLTPALEPLR